MPQESNQAQINVTPHSVPLTATRTGNRVTVTGNGGANLPQDSGAHRFNFTVSSPPGLTIEFDSLDTQDNCSTCPPASGENSTQIVGVQINGSSASFTDNNNNKNEMDVSYQWNFTCSDPKVGVDPFDPIIKNGGTTGGGGNG